MHAHAPHEVLDLTWQRRFGAIDEDGAISSTVLEQLLQVVLLIHACPNHAHHQALSAMRYSMTR